MAVKEKNWQIEAEKWKKEAETYKSLYEQERKHRLNKEDEERCIKDRFKELLIDVLGR